MQPSTYTPVIARKVDDFARKAQSLRTALGHAYVTDTVKQRAKGDLRELRDLLMEIRACLK